MARMGGDHQTIAAEEPVVAPPRDASSRMLASGNDCRSPYRKSHLSAFSEVYVFVCLYVYVLVPGLITDPFITNAQTIPLLWAFL